MANHRGACRVLHSASLRSKIGQFGPDAHTLTRVVSLDFGSSRTLLLRRYWPTRSSISGRKEHRRPTFQPRFTGTLSRATYGFGGAAMVIRVDSKPNGPPYVGFAVILAATSVCRRDFATGLVAS